MFTTATVGNVPGPKALFDANPPVVDILSPDVSFTDLSYTGITGWVWDFGDGPPGSSQQHPTHTYGSEGTFVVTLIVTTASGCKDTIQQTVVVEGYSSIYVPNTFTPNNDGLNDLFGPLFSRIDINSFSMMIFDRWGNQIFNSTKLGEFWNGKVRNSGEVVQEDVYVYVIVYYDLKKKEHKLIGNVNVVK